jgi:hypothetical protein
MTARVSAPNDEATLRSSKERKARTPSQSVPCKVPRGVEFIVRHLRTFLAAAFVACPSVATFRLRRGRLCPIPRTAPTTGNCSGCPRASERVGMLRVRNPNGDRFVANPNLTNQRDACGVPVPFRCRVRLGAVL